MEYRPATDQDSNGIASVYVVAHAVAYQAPEDLPYLHLMDVAVEAQYLAPAIGNQQGRFEVAVEDGQIIGFSYGGLTDQPGLAGFAELWVHPHHHGSVVAKQLFVNFVEAMIDKGAVQIVCFVADHNARATAFMQKMNPLCAGNPPMRIFDSVAALPAREVPSSHWRWDDLPALAAHVHHLIGQEMQPAAEEPPLGAGQ